MTTRLLTVALGLAWVAALVGLIWMTTLAGMRPSDLLYMLFDIDIVLNACAALSVVSAIIGIVGARAGVRRRAQLGLAGALGWGGLGGLLGAANARNMLISINPPIPFSVYAPNYAEALLILLVGLTGALLVVFSLRGSRRV